MSPHGPTDGKLPGEHEVVNSRRFPRFVKYVKLRTICKHVEHILSKLGVENRTAAAAAIALTALASAKKE
jgi:hypothetical protein